MARGEVGKDEMVRDLPFSHTQFYLLSERPPPTFLHVISNGNV